MEQVFKALSDIANASGANKKATLLQKYADVPLFKDTLRFVYDPYIRTGIAAKKLVKATPIEGRKVSLVEIMDYLREHPTGSATDANMARTFTEAFTGDPVWENIAGGIVTKTLKIGASVKTLNKVFGSDFIPMIGIMRGEHYEDFKEKVAGPFIATEKIDGVRRLLIKEDGKVSLYSRSGIHDEGLVEIEAEAVHLPDNCVFDGELEAEGEFDNAIDLRMATIALANKQGERVGLRFKAFDMIALDEYKTGKSTHPAKIRKLMLGALFGDESIHVLSPTRYKTFIETYKLPFEFKKIMPIPIEGIAHDEDTVMRLATPIWRRGFEGIMLVQADSMYDYTITKSRNLLKVKHVEEHTLKVVDVEVGKPGTKNSDRLGALVVEFEGNRVGVGSGLNDDLRVKWWANPALIVGKSIEIESFGRSTNQHGGTSLNCPIFKRVVGEE